MKKKLSNFSIKNKFIIIIPFFFSLIFYFYSSSIKIKYETEILLNRDLINIGMRRSFFLGKLTSQNNFSNFVNTYNSISLEKSQKKKLIESFGNFMFDNSNNNLEKIYGEDKNTFNIIIKHDQEADVQKLLSDYVYYCYFENLISDEEKKYAKINNVYKKIEVALTFLEKDKILSELFFNNFTKTIGLDFKNDFTNNMFNKLNPQDLSIFFTRDYLVAQKEYYFDLLNQMQVENDKFKFIKNSYLVAKDNKVKVEMEENIKKILLGWQPIIKSSTVTIGPKKINYTIQGFIFGIIIIIMVLLIKFVLLKKIQIQIFK